MEINEKTKWDPVKQFTISRKRIWKLVNYLWIIAIVIFVIMGIVFVKNIFFPPAGDNVHKPRVIVLPGGSFTGNVDQSSEQKNEKSRPWWKPIPYVLVYGGTRTGVNRGGISSQDFEPEVGAQIGLRWDF